MSENSGALNADLLSQLECPVCNETCLPPIYMCRNGHSVCGDCRPQLTRCAMCSAPGMPSLRSMQLERIAEIVKMPCPYQSRGCQFLCNLAEKATHLPVCEFGGFLCHICKEWRGEVDDLIQHVAHEHTTHLVHMPTTNQSIISIQFNYRQDNAMLVAGNNALFWFDLKPGLSGQFISCTMRLVSDSSKQASKFNFFVKFSSDSANSGVIYDDTYQSNFVIPTALMDSCEDRGFAMAIGRQISYSPKNAREFKYYWVALGVVAFVAIAYIWNKETKVVETELAEDHFEKLLWLL